MADASMFQFLEGATKGASALSSVLTGSTAHKQSLAESTASRVQAARERQIAADEERDFRIRQSAEAAKRRAALGASGTDAGTGTPLIAMGDFAGEVELQARRIREGGRIRAQRLEEEADLTRKAGRSAMKRGLIRGGASLFGASPRFDRPTIGRD